MSRFGILLLLAASSTCSLSRSPQAAGGAPLSGTWVKTTGDKDTLRFTDPGHFTLTLQHGSLPPRDPEGLYSYKITGDSIHLEWWAASTINRSKLWYFKRYGDYKLAFGKFYNAPGEKDQLEFKKTK